MCSGFKTYTLSSLREWLENKKYNSKLVENNGTKNSANMTIYLHFEGLCSSTANVDKLHFHLLDNILIVLPPVSINPQTRPQAAPWIISGAQKIPPINL